MRRLYRPTKPHFFQPLIPGFITEFSIPKSFWKYYLGGNNANIGEKMALLQDKRGRIWDVKINKMGKFKDGWERFCIDNDLQIGDFVVFRHLGYWVFDVFIFDPNACERRPTNSSFNSVGNSDANVNYVKAEPSEEDKQVRGQSIPNVRSRKGYNDVVNDHNDVVTSLNSAANNVRSEMTNELLHRRKEIDRLKSIPKAFSKHLKDGSKAEIEGDDDNKVAILRDKSRRNWVVKLDYINLKFKDGWKKFCEEHNLQIGDFLVFKYQGDLIFDVFIFDPTACEREIPVSISPLSTSTSNDPNKGLANWETKKVFEHNIIDFKPIKHACFSLEINIKPYNYKSSALYMPKRLPRQYGLNKSQVVELIDEKGDKFLMPFRIDRNNAYIGRWQDFHRAKRLNVGDTIILELIKCMKEEVNFRFLFKIARRQCIRRIDQASSSPSKAGISTKGLT
ncbi:putative B3 domain-containing protein REM15 [Bienertia sinuspersici]